VPFGGLALLDYLDLVRHLVKLVKVLNDLVPANQLPVSPRLIPIELFRRNNVTHKPMYSSLDYLTDFRVEKKKHLGIFLVSHRFNSSQLFIV
jgi:hypothetical protein